MNDLVTIYGDVLVAWVGVGGLLLVQAVVADVAGVRAKHTPGMPVTTGHDDFLFRAVRAQANTLENAPAFIALSLTAMLLGGSPQWIAVTAWTFVAARVVHMAAYYADIRSARSLAFAVSFVALAGMLVIALRAIT